MKRLIIRHCRDMAVFPNVRWEVWCKDTDDPRGEPLFVGFGSYRSCREMVVWLTMLKQEVYRDWYWTGFSSPMETNELLAFDYG